MTNTSNVYCRQIAELLVAHGVKTAFCSPGSRNAPLLLAMEAHEEIAKRVIVDERSAAFQALGCAIVSREPVVLVCTSGTALLNYAPAVAEAYYAGIPLIVVSADRPLEWIDQDDSQTIRQKGILSHIVKGSYDVRAIPEGEYKEFSKDVMWMVNRTVNEAMHRALEGKQGPVHINVQLDSPLGETCSALPLDERIVTLLEREETVPQRILDDLSVTAAECKVMLVAGFGYPDHELNRAVQQFASFGNVAVMAETLSNLHVHSSRVQMVDSVLAVMSEEEKETFRPDIVISMGGALVSRMLKQYLRDFPPVRHWALGHSNYFCDCFQCMTDRIDVAPAAFLRRLAATINKKVRKSQLQIRHASYESEWEELRAGAEISASQYIEKAPWSDLKAADMIFRTSALDNVFVSNGTAIRYSQLIPHTCHAEYCNRGVSGIDGTTATAAGAARAYPGRTALITGDMSFLYDSGASTLADLPSDMRIIVIDNGGGGIFRFIGATSSIPSDTLDEYFCVDNLPDITRIADAYGLETRCADSLKSLRQALPWLQESSQHPRLLLIKTPPEESAEVLKGYFKRKT